MEGPDPTWLSLLPALVTIFLAFATRQVLVALFAGVLTGSVVLLFQGSSVLDANPITRFLLPAIGSKGYAKILLIYLWCLGGLIGVWARTGGARHFAATVGQRVAQVGHAVHAVTGIPGPFTPQLAIQPARERHEGTVGHPAL